MPAIELLAPAKNIDAGMAAIHCGADAVYIGAARFGARAAAGNSVQDIERLAQYAHRYWAKVYVTLNTLLYDDELPDALKLIAQLYEAGIDGLILQDVGLLECDLPPLPLIAGTQMHNTTPEKVAFLEQVGFQRVILARELSLEQIRHIKQKTSIELEAFVHGALCVSYSGQCYLSYAIGGRSGNRGQCAQPCRKRYSLRDSSGKMLSQDRYLLSLKDMNRSGYLREMIEAGITSFKIEGRLKDEAYVKNVVSFYRQKLDAVLADCGLKKSSSGTSRIDFTPDPVKTFNRGYTTYFLTGGAVQFPFQEEQNVGARASCPHRGGGQDVRAPRSTVLPPTIEGNSCLRYGGNTVASINTPKSIGEQIGTVRSVAKRSFTIESSIPLHNGDGLCFFDATQNLRGTVINRVEENVVYPADMKNIQPGTVIYRNYDHEFLARLKKSQVERKIDVTLTFRDISNGFLLVAVDEDGNRAEQILHDEKESARDGENATASLKKQLAKFGATEFACTECVLELSAPFFLPVSRINAMRRAVLEQLTSVRAQNRPVSKTPLIKNAVPYPDHTLSYLGNVLNSKAEAFYRRHGVNTIEPAAESGLDMREKTVMTTRYCLKQQFGFCEKKEVVSQHFQEPIYLIDERGERYRLRFDCVKCEMSIFLDVEHGHISRLGGTDRRSIS